MISLRYHLLSLTVAVLALVLGLVLGASTLSGRLIDSLTADRADLTARTDTLHGELAAERGRNDAVERFVAQNAATTVRGQLAGRSVAVLTLGDAEPADVTAVSDLATKAGARLTGRLELTPAATAPERAGELRALVPRLLPAGAQLPTTTDASQLTGALLGSLVARRPGDLGLGTPTAQRDREVVTALSGLAGAGFVRPVAATAPEPAQLVLVVAGGDPDQVRGRAGAALAAAIGSRAGGAVLAGRDASGAVAALRAEPAVGASLEAVDDVAQPSARVRSVLALHDQSAPSAGGTGTAQPAANVTAAPAGGPRR